MTGNYPLLRPDRKSPCRTASPLLLARKGDTGWKNPPPLLPPQRWCLLPPIKPDYASPGPPGSAFLLVRADLRRDWPWRDGPIQPRSSTTLPRCLESADLKYAMFAGLLASPSAPLCCSPGGWPRRAVRFRQRPPCRKRSGFFCLFFLGFYQLSGFLLQIWFVFALIGSVHHLRTCVAPTCRSVPARLRPVHCPPSENHSWWRVHLPLRVSPLQGWAFQAWSATRWFGGAGLLQGQLQGSLSHV